MFDTSNDENPKNTKTQGGKADNDVNSEILKSHFMNRIMSSCQN